jgi:hypothetical protein
MLSCRGRHVWLRATIVLVALVAACGESTAPGGPVSGRWTSDTAFSFPIDVTLTHRDTIIEGQGTMFATPARDISVIGFFSSSPSATNRIILTFAGVNTIPAIFFGNLSADRATMTGEYRWTSGLPTETVTFTRRN